jgi:hypothetical protein
MQLICWQKFNIGGRIFSRQLEMRRDSSNVCATRALWDLDLAGLTNLESRNWSELFIISNPFGIIFIFAPFFAANKTLDLWIKVSSLYMILTIFSRWLAYCKKTHKNGQLHTLHIFRKNLNPQKIPMQYSIPILNRSQSFDQIPIPNRSRSFDQIPIPKFWPNPNPKPIPMFWLNTGTDRSQNINPAGL